jgi:hypothetical protein
MSFVMTQEWKSKLLRPRLVREDVYIRGPEPDELEMIREALERGLKPGSFKVADDTLILRFERNESRKPLQEE